MARKKRKPGKPPNTWKATEREVAEFFGGHRIPLSGRNNVDDKGNPRVGDILAIPDNLLVEVKLRQSIATVKRALETKALAAQYNKGIWVHIERQKGNKDVWVLCCDKSLFINLCKVIKVISEPPPVIAEFVPLPSAQNKEGADSVKRNESSDSTNKDNRE